MSPHPQVRKEIEAALIAKTRVEPSFRKALLTDARATIERALGFHLPAGKEIRVLEETGTDLYVVLPAEPTDELSDADLEAVAGGTGKT